MCHCCNPLVLVRTPTESSTCHHHSSWMTQMSGKSIRSLTTGFITITRDQGSLLSVSALHYSAGDRVWEGFQTVASAHALHQPTSCRSKYFYNRCPQVPNSIGTECSLNRSERRVQNEAS